MPDSPAPLPRSPSPDRNTPGGSQPDLRARQRAVVLAFGRRPAAHDDSSALMRDAVELIAETLRLPLHAVAEVASDTGEIRFRASATRGLSELDDASCTYSPDPAASLVGHALAAGQPIVSSNLADDQRFHDEFLGRLGVSAGIALPLSVGGRPIGALTALSLQPLELALEDVDFAESLTQLLSATLGRVAAEQLMARSQSTLDQFWNSSDNLLLITDWSGRIVKANAMAEKLLGQSADALRGQSLETLQADPQDTECTTRILRQATQTPAALRFQSRLRGSEGQPRPFRWTVAALPNDRGVAESILFDGIDVSEELRLAAEVEQLQTTLRSTQLALAKLVAKAQGEPAPVDGGELHAESHPQPFQVLEPDASTVHNDSQRRAFPYRQLIAPRRGAQVPAASEFAPVQFRDISAAGVSFLSKTRPDYEQVVIRLGDPPNVQFVVAQVVDMVEVTYLGRKMTSVGCRFVERLASLA